MDVIKNLSEAIKIKTVSNSDYEKINFSEFDKFIEYLKNTYKLVHSHLEFTRVNTYGLVYRWRGESKDKLPIMFIAHYDVVPVENNTEKDWKYDAFSGIVAEERIWGRGTLDIKSQVIAILETAEQLLNNGYMPERDIFFAFGHDEEVGGRNGAKQIAEYFSEKNIKFEAIYDEGGIVITDAMKNVKSPMALIGIAEKGYCDVKIKVNSDGGHSSMPPKNTALGNLSKIICEIEKKPMKAKLCMPVHNMLKNICSEMGILVEIAVKNSWLFKPVLIKILSSSPMTNAMVRTTTAATMSKASDAPNVLPQNAIAVINSRLLPGDSSEDLVNHIKQITDKYNAEVEKIQVEEPSQISPIDTIGYMKLQETIKKIFGNVIVTPYLVMGGTDSRKYEIVCNNIYRFTPCKINSEEQSTMHNTNESITIENYYKMLNFYEYIITNFDK